MKKNNVGKSNDVQDAVSDEESYIDYAKRLAKTFNFSSSSSQHIRTVDGKVTSSSINDVQDAVSDEESYIDYAKRLAKTFNFSSSSSQHIRTVDGKVTSSSITHNNPGTDFMNQLKKFENNEDISEKNIKDKDFYYKEMMKSQGKYYL
jgi:hypothetical protein